MLSIQDVRKAQNTSNVFTYSNLSTYHFYHYANSYLRKYLLLYKVIGTEFIT